MRPSMLHTSVALACLVFCNTSYAGGRLNLEPSVRTSISYDDNIFRFSSDAQADSSGLNKSDTIKTLEVGLVGQLALSRQLISASAVVNENRYSNNDVLDNQGHALNLRWNWRLGDHLYGELSANNQRSLTGFDNNNIRIKNVRDIDTQFVSLNWNFLPRLTAYGQVQVSQQENDTTANAIFDRDDDVYEFGLRYVSKLGNQAGVFFRQTDTDYPNRTSFLSALYGDGSVAREYGVNVLWRPTTKLQLSGRLSNYDFIRDDAVQEDFSNLNYRFNLTYLLSSKVEMLLSAYDEAVQVDSNVASNVKFNGVDVDLTWRITDKVSLNGGLQYQKRAFQGDAFQVQNLGSSFVVIPLSLLDQTVDKRTTSLVGISYRPVDNAFIQLRYRMDDRRANVTFNEFESNFFEIAGKYTF